MPYKELHECFANMVRGRRNRPLQETAIVLITTPKALLALAYIRTAQQVHAWCGAGVSESTKPNSAQRWPGMYSGIWVVAGCCEG